MMLGPAEIFTFLFVMLGPLKLLGPFVQRTRGLDDATVRQIALDKKILPPKRLEKLLDPMRMTKPGIAAKGE